MPISARGANFAEAYRSLIEEFIQLDFTRYQARPAIVVIDQPLGEHGLPANIKGRFSKYYRVFASGELDSHWQVGSGWYLSYSRRLFSILSGKTQFELALGELLRDKTSRRCLLTTSFPEAGAWTSLPALSSIWCGIDEENNFDVHSTWRSNDLLKSFPIKALAMRSFMRLALRHVQSRWPDVRPGSYLECIHSLHAFPSDFRYVDPAKPLLSHLEATCAVYSESDILRLWSIVLEDKT